MQSNSLKSLVTGKCNSNYMEDKKSHSYMYDEEDRVINIKFRESKEDSTTTIECATLEKIVEWSTHENFDGSAFISALLYSYKLYTNPETLARLLIKRFQVPIPMNMCAR
jgi:RasGEF N-terminal motif